MNGRQRSKKLSLIHNQQQSVSTGRVHDWGKDLDQPVIFLMALHILKISIGRPGSLINCSHVPAQLMPATEVFLIY